MQTRKREFWNNAEPERLPDQWRMTKVKGDHTMTFTNERKPSGMRGGSLLLHSG
jgi:hypothetical protein